MSNYAIQMRLKRYKVLQRCCNDRMRWRLMTPCKFSRKEKEQRNSRDLTPANPKGLAGGWQATDVFPNIKIRNILNRK